jgi:hypothetical protein
MLLNVALGGMLLFSVGALVASHHFGWLADYVLRSPRKYVKSSGSSWNRLPVPPSDSQILSDLPAETGIR